MKLLEYQAMELFAKYGLRTQKSAVLSEKEAAVEAIEAAGVAYPLVMKAQVQVSGRGKAGGIRFAENAAEAQAHVDRLLFSELKGHRVNQLLAVEKAQIETEWYLSILLDRDAKSPRIIFSTRGGMDIEQTAAEHPGAVVSVTVNPLIGLTGYITHYLCSKSGAGPEHFDRLHELLTRLYQLFMEYSCMLMEINPLALEPGGTLLAVDGKVDIDDSALYRLPDVAAYRDSLEEHPLVVEARSFRFLYIPLAAEGRTAVMSNGSGMLMSMLDLLNKEGVMASCALDLGGGATRERIGEAVRIVLSAPGVDTLFICIFGGITRCDEVAGGVRDALAHTGGKTVVIRMEGTNKEAGMEIIGETPGAIPVGGIVEGVQAVAGRCKA